MSSEQNKEIGCKFYDNFNSGNLKGYDEILAPNIVDHNPLPGQKPGAEGVKQAVAMFRQGFPDMHFHVDEQIVEGDKLVQRTTGRGTHTGDMMGIPPTNKSVTITATDIYKLSGGKIVEAWHVEDLLGMMQQIGVAPS